MSMKFVTQIHSCNATHIQHENLTTWGDNSDWRDESLEYS